MSSSSDPIVRLELPVIAKIIDDEVWLEGERRGGPVPSDDPVVRGTVCEIILRVGRDLRAQCEAALDRQAGQACSEDDGERAA